MRPNLTLFIIAMFISFASTNAYGQTCTWLGGNGNWTDPTKWSCGTVPGPNNDVVIDSGNVFHRFFFNEAPDTITIKSLTLNGGLLQMGSYFVLLEDFNWRDGSIHGTPGVSLGYSGGHMIINGPFNIFGKTNTPALGILEKRIIAKMGGVWANPGTVNFVNTSVTFEQNPFELELQINCNTRNAVIEGIDTDLSPIRPFFSASCGIVKNGPFNLTMRPTSLGLSNSYFQINKGNVSIVPYYGSGVSNENFFVPDNSRLTINHSEHSRGGSSFWVNARIDCQGTLLLNNLSQDSENRFTLVGGTTINADTLICTNEYGNVDWIGIDYFRGLTIHQPIVANYLEFSPGNYWTTNVNCKVYKSSNGVNLAVHPTGVFTADVAYIPGGSLGGGGGFTVNDSLFLLTQPPGGMRFTGINFLLKGYGQMGNINIPVSNGIDFFTLLEPRNTSFEIAPTGTLEMVLSANSSITPCCNFEDGEGVPYTTSFINKGTLRISASGGMPECSINMPFTNNSGTINLSNVKLNTSDFTLLGFGSIWGRTDVNVAGNFNCTPVFARLISTRLNLSGNSVITKGTMQLLDGAGILVQYGAKLTVCTEGPVDIYNPSRDRRCYLANYGSFIKASGSQLFRSEVFLKNGRDMLIYGGTVMAVEKFVNLNLVRGFGTLDLSAADSVSNTGTFTGGVTMTGTLSITGDYKNSTLLIDIRGDNPVAGPSNDKLAVSDSMDITGSKLTVRERGTAPADTSYVIMECSGGPDCRIGEFSTFDMPAGYSVIYTGNQVILQKGTGLLQARTGATVKDALVNSKFRVYRVSGRVYRIENTAPNAEINIISTSGALMKKYKVSNYNTIDLTGLAKGIYVAINLTTQQQFKFVVY